jgi:diguanylate cyclase (GGDEF)-like protein
MPARCLRPAVAALVLLFAASCPAADDAAQAALPWRPLVDQNSAVWTSRDGLPHNQVNAMAQTADGLLWVGTYEGLARFDGMAFDVLRPENTPGLTDASVRDLFVDGRGRLFAALGRGGVSVLEGGIWTPMPVLQPAPGDQALEVLFDRAGRLWVGYDSGEVHRVDADGSIDVIEGLAGGQVRALAESADGALWVASNGGLSRVEGRVVRRFGRDDGLFDGAVRALAFDAGGAPIVASGNALLRWDGERFAALDGGDAAGSVVAITRQGGSIVAGTASRGLLRLGGGHPAEVFGRAEGLANDRVVSLMVDREGSLWVGTSRGLQRFAAMPVRNITSRDGLGDAYVRTLLETPDGRLFIGGLSGLYRWESGRATPVLDAAGQAIDSVLSLALAADGSLWVGTYTTGLRRVRNGAVEPRSATPQPAGDAEIRGLVEDRPGRLWVGTNAGLFRLEGGQVTAYTRADGLPSEHVRRLFVDARGVLWVATNLGLARFEQERFQAIDVSAANDARTVFAIDGRDDGSLWLATDRGLVLLGADGRARGVGTAEGLPPSTLFEVMADDGGDLWVDSNRGVGRIGAASLAGWLKEGRPLDVLQLDESSGMVTAQASGGAGRAMLQRRASGEIWVALAGGIARIDPRELDRFSMSPPRVVVQGLRIDARRLPVAGRVEVPPGAMRLEFDYVSPTFLTPRGVVYRHRLVGFEDDWVLSERGQRSTQYTNLKPGRYRFEVESSYDGRRWSSGSAPIDVLVRVRWWQHPLTWGAALVVVGLGALLAFRWRVKALEARQHELSAQVAERTRELADKNRALESFNRLITTRSQSFEAQALTDALTGLPNRRAFEERLRTVVVGARPAVVGLLDIDHFKRINDGFSHEAGDRVLELVAEVLRQELGLGLGRRTEDPFAARWGGEEFALLWPGRDLAAAIEAAERLRRRVAALDFGGLLGGARITVSIGLAADAGQGQAPEALLRAADERLYAAKSGGRDRVEA